MSSSSTWRMCWPAGPAPRNEFVFHLEDVLARRTRALFLDAAASLEMAEKTAGLMAEELGKDAAWCEKEVKEFRETAAGYLVQGG